MKKILSMAAIIALDISDPLAASYARTARRASPVARRLDELKRKAASAVETIQKNWPGGTARDAYAAERGNWRNHRYPRIHGGRWGDKPDETGEIPFYVDRFDSDLRLRELGRADEVAEREGAWRAVDHSGWYTREDDFGETVAGYVFQLPARNGQPVYIAGLAWSDCDGVTLYPLARSDEPLDAAIQADRIAERMSESQREYNAAWDAGSRWAQLGEEITESRREVREAITQFRDARRALQTGGPLPSNPDGATMESRFSRLCALIRSDVADLLESIAKARRERAELKDAWEAPAAPYAASSWQLRKAELADAFRDGAAIA